MLCCKHGLQRDNNITSHDTADIKECKRKNAKIGGTWDGFAHELLGLNADFEKRTAACNRCDAIANAKRRTAHSLAPPEVSSTVKAIGFKEVNAAWLGKY